MNKYVVLGLVMATPLPLQGCITSALWRPYTQGDSTNPVADAQIEKVCLMGAENGDRRSAAILILIKDLKPNPQGADRTFLNLLQNPSGAIVVESSSRELRAFRYQLDTAESEMVGRTFRSIDLQVICLEPRDNARFRCRGKLTFHSSNRTIVLNSLLGIRAATAGEVEPPSLGKLYAAESKKAEFRELAVRAPSAPFYVYLLTPLTVAVDTACVVGLVTVFVATSDEALSMARSALKPCTLHR